MGIRYFALIAGIVYVIVGLLGFIPGFLHRPEAGATALTVEAGYGYLFGLFPVNILHNLVHLGVGIWGIVAYRTLPSARGLLEVWRFFTGS